MLVLLPIITAVQVLITLQNYVASILTELKGTVYVETTTTRSLYINNNNLASFSNSLASSPLSAASPLSFPGLTWIMGDVTTFIFDTLHISGNAHVVYSGAISVIH